MLSRVKYLLYFSRAWRQLAFLWIEVLIGSLHSLHLLVIGQISRSFISTQIYRTLGRRKRLRPVDEGEQGESEIQPDSKPKEKKVGQTSLNHVKLHFSNANSLGKAPTRRILIRESYTVLFMYGICIMNAKIQCMLVTPPPPSMSYFLGDQTPSSESLLQRSWK